MNNIKRFGELSAQEIVELEKELCIKFPEDYKQFLMNKNGGIPKEKYLTMVIPDVNEEFVLGALLGVSNNQNFDLIGWNKEYRDDMIEDTIIIGTEYNSGLVILINQLEEQGIYYWDNAYVLENSSDEENVHKLADSFMEFMEKLQLG